MLDQYVRPFIDPPLNYIGKNIASYGVSKNYITIILFLFGLVAIVLIIVGYNIEAILFILLNRLFDGLDGAVARHTKLNDFGGFLDIVCDFIIYSGVVFAFGVYNPNNLFYSSFLIFSFIGTISSFLAYAIIAAKNNVNTTIRGKKSFYYLGGICEGTETALFLILICILPTYFSLFCIVYGVLCWITTIGRVYNSWTDFGLRDNN